MSKSQELDLHMEWQRVMGKAPVDRVHVEYAIQKIRSGEIEADCYPNGAPSISAAYLVALQLEKDASTIQ